MPEYIAINLKIRRYAMSESGLCCSWWIDEVGCAATITSSDQLNLHFCLDLRSGRDQWLPGIG